jgi:outer membrane autotransporter protein
MSLLASAAAASMLAAISVLPQQALADTHWSGAAGDGDWNNPANWTNGLPDGSSTSRIAGGASLTVDGTTGQLNKWTYFGYGGSSGEVSLVNGGTLQGGCCFYLGSGGNGSMLVSGEGSQLVTSSVFAIGHYSGEGNLLIENGGRTDTGYVMIGRYGGSTGTVTVTGEGSVIQSNYQFVLGGEGSSSTYNASATLNLLDGGVARSGTSGGSEISVAQSYGTTATVNIGNGGAPGSIEASLIRFGNGTGTVNINHNSEDYVLSVPLSGNGTLNHFGGITHLTGNSSGFTGTTHVEGGSLLAGGKLGGNVEVGSKGLLGGQGSIGGSVTVDGTLAAGDGPGTLQIGGNLILGDASRSLFELAEPGVAGGTGNDLVKVAGDLTLGGSLLAEVAAAGYYRLFEYGGTLAGAFAETSILAANRGDAFTGSQVVSGIPGSVYLVVQGEGQAVQFWDGTDTAGDGEIGGGSGTWDNDTTNWSQAPGFEGFNERWAGSVGVFGGTSAGTVTVSGEVAFDTLQFSTSGYTLEGGTLSAAPATGSNGTVQVDENVSATIGSAIAGEGMGLVKTGEGRLVLTGANTYSGGTVIEGGILQGDTESLTGDVHNQAVLVFDQTGNGTFEGQISGTGSVEKAGSGILTLGGANSYTGGTLVSGGTLQGDTQSLTGNIENNAQLAFQQQADGTFSGGISGTGSLAKTGAGRLILSGNNSYSGGTTISEGILEGDASSLGGDIANNSALVFNSDDGGVFRGDIWGTGSVTKTGTGQLVLSGRNSYSGGTTILGGTLFGNTASLQGDIVNNASLIFDEGGADPDPRLEARVLSNEFTAEGRVEEAGTYSGVISGTGTVSKTGYGTLVLTGANSYSGGTLVSGGILKGTTGSLQGDFANDATLAFDQDFDGEFAGAVSGLGTLVKDGAGRVTLTGTNTYSGGTEVVGGALVGTSNSLQGVIYNDAELVFDQDFDGTYSGILVGTGTFIKSGDGELILASQSTKFRGTTEVAGGLLTINGSIGGDLVVNGGAVGGTGNLGAITVSGGGILAPGNSIGVINVANAEFKAGSVYEVEVNDAGNSPGVNNDTVVASGTATIDSAASVHVSPVNGTDDGSTYVPGIVYTILTAAGGVNGEFNPEVIDDFLLLDGRLSYDTNAVYLTLSKTMTLDAVGHSANQIATGGALEAAGTGNAAYEAIILLSTEAEVRDGLDALSGEIHASLRTALADNAAHLQASIDQRMNQPFDTPGTNTVSALALPSGSSSGRSIAGGPTYWIQGFGASGRWDGNSNAAAMDRNLSGILAGVESTTGADGVAGLTAGYSNASLNVDGRSSSAGIESYHLGGYAAGSFDDWVLRIGGTFSWHEVETLRSVAFTGFSNKLKSDYSAYTGQVFAEAGYRFETLAGRIEPFAGITLVHSGGDGFVEKGGAAALSGSDWENSRSYVTFGMRAASAPVLSGGMTMRLTGSVAWKHALGDTGTNAALSFATGPGFKVTGTRAARDQLTVDAGAQVMLDGTSRLDIGYHGAFSRSSRDHAVSATLSVAF